MNEKLEKLFIENMNVVSCKLLLENGYTKYQIKKMVNDNMLIHLT